MRTTTRLPFLLAALTLLAPVQAVAGAADTGALEPAADEVVDSTAATDAGAADAGDADDAAAAGSAESTEDEGSGDAGGDEVAASSDGFGVRRDVASVGDPRPEVRFRGAGWGHGVGMSQYGAYAMAREGRTFREILSHYYPGTATHRASQHGVDTTRTPIRVGLVQGISSAPVEARSGQPAWEVCDADGPFSVRSCTPVDNRHTPQPQGSTWRACPGSGGGIEVREGSCGGPSDEVRITTGRDVLRVRNSGGAIVAPIGSFSVPREIRRGVHEIRRVGSQMRTIQRLSTIEEYLYGLFEMPGGWGDRGGSAALRAQAVTGRTFAISRHRSPRGASCDCHLLATPADQAWYGHTQEQGTGGERWRAAVDATRTTDPEEGIVLAHGGGLAQTFYSSSHGGRTENIEDSWAYGTTPIAYLRSQDDPWSLDAEVGNPYRSWVGTRSNAAVADFLSRGIDGTLRTVEQIRIRNRTQGGTPRELEVRGRDRDGSVVSGVYTHPGSGKPIAGAHLRTGLPGVTVINANGATASLSTLPSSQIRRIGFAPFDDDDGGVHEYATVWAHEAGIAQGRTETRFEPGGAVTRGQMAAFMYRTFEIPEPSSDQFDDVSEEHPHREAINALAEAGIAQGYDDDTYRPGERVTRAQMGSFLRRALGLDEVEPDGRFGDVEGGPHAGAVHAIADAGITQGCAPNRYCPHDPVERGQMTTFLHRAVEGGR